MPIKKKKKLGFKETKPLKEVKAPTFEDDKKEIDKKIKQAEKRKQKCIDELYVLNKRKAIIGLQEDIENKIMGKQNLYRTSGRSNSITFTLPSPNYTFTNC